MLLLFTFLYWKNNALSLFGRVLILIIANHAVKNRENDRYLSYLVNMIHGILDGLLYGCCCCLPSPVFRLIQWPLSSLMPPPAPQNSCTNWAGVLCSRSPDRSRSRWFRGGQQAWCGQTDQSSCERLTHMEKPSEAELDELIHIYRSVVDQTVPPRSTTRSATLLSHFT